MNSTNRIIINTIAQYTKTFINIILSLYSSRIVLMILGESDFGIYSLIAGIVALLSFLTNSMVMSTQRFLSIGQGKGEVNELKTIFNNSLILHLFIGLLIVCIFACMTPFLFNGFLNIPLERVSASRILYFTIIGVLFISFQTSPYKALLVSHENIVYTSIIDVIDGALKLFLVLLLPYISVDSLIIYGFMILGIQIFNFAAFSIYGYCHYKECVFINFTKLNFEYLKKLAGFTGWVTFSSFCIIGRNQGFAIVINKLLATTANAAYGIANQLSGYLNFLSSSLSNSVAPQLMQAVGKNDMDRAFFLTKFQSKMACLLFGLFAIPLMFEMDSILTIWLKVYPEYTSLFSIMIVSSVLIDQPTYGITTLFQAIGKLAFFSIMFYMPKFLILPISYFILKSSGSLIYVAFTYFSIEAVCMFLRLYYIKRVLPFFNIANYIIEVFVKLLVPLFTSILVCFLITINTDHNLRFILTFMLSGLVYILTSYFYALSDLERNKILVYVNKFINKKNQV